MFFLMYSQDDIPELAESFNLLLISAELVDDSSSSSPTIGPQNNLTVVILENDNAYGVLQFERATLSLEEENRIVAVTVLRELGSFGVVRVSVVDVAMSATNSEDYAFNFTVSVDRVLSVNLYNDLSFECFSYTSVYVCYHSVTAPSPDSNIRGGRN